MIQSFPTPYPDELLYSVIARYHLRCGYTSDSMTAEDLFGNRMVLALVDLPSHLDTLTKRLGGLWESEMLIKNHTLYPYYAPFLPPWQANILKDSMLRKNQQSLPGHFGINGGLVKKKKKLWLCDFCVEEDITKYGETYWHRLHQATGVYICPKHSQYLKETEVSISANTNRKYIYANPEIKRFQSDIREFDEKEKLVLLSIAQGTEILINTNFPSLDVYQFPRLYFNDLNNMGYTNGGSRVKRTEVLHSFASQFSNQCLKVLQSEVTSKNSDWLSNIFRNKKVSFHPVRHLLILMFLRKELEELFSYSSSVNNKSNEFCFENNQDEIEIQQTTNTPFGKGLWPCLNITCPKYRDSVSHLIEIRIGKKSKAPIGIFECSCGFSYKRTGPDDLVSDRYNYSVIIEVGPIWKKKLARLVNEKKTLTDIAKELNVSLSIVKRFSLLSGLEVPWKPYRYRKRSFKQRKEMELKSENYKSKWLFLQEKYPNESYVLLGKREPIVYNFLQRHDLEWLHQNSNQRELAYSRINWDQRDSEMLLQVEKLIANWDVYEKRLTRISFNAIANRLSVPVRLTTKENKLPKTMAFIESVLENPATFQLRRVNRVLSTYRENGLNHIKVWEVLRDTSLAQNATEQTKKYISMKVEEYNSMD